MLNAVADLSPANAWAVGLDKQSGTRSGSPLIVHWNGTVGLTVAAPSGLTGTLRFTPHKPATPTACWFQATIRDGHFISPNNGKRQCVPFDASIR